MQLEPPRALRMGLRVRTATPQSACGAFKAPGTFTFGNSRPDHAKQQKCPIAHSKYNLNIAMKVEGDWLTSYAYRHFLNTITLNVQFSSWS